MFTIISRRNGAMEVEEILGTDSLRAANLRLKRFAEAHTDAEVFLHLGSRASETGERYFSTTDDGDIYRFPAAA